MYNPVCPAFNWTVFRLKINDSIEINARKSNISYDEYVVDDLATVDVDFCWSLFVSLNTITGLLCVGEFMDIAGDEQCMEDDVVLSGLRKIIVGSAIELDRGFEEIDLFGRKLY